MPPTNNNPPPTISPGQEIDTGTGGFPIEGKRITYDVGSDVGDSPPQDWSSGQINVNDALQDISTGTKRTLASYLSKTTMGQTPSSPSSIKNTYPIDQKPSADPVTLSLNDEKGYPTNPSGASNGSKFVSDGTLSSRSGAAANLNIIRGRQAPNDKASIDGHTLLKNATMLQSDTVINPSSLDGKLPSLHTTAIDNTSPIKNYYGSPQLSNSVIFNRFNPEGSRYEDKGGFGSFQFASKYEMGTSAADRNMSHARLAQIGNALSIRAGLELTSTQDNNNPTDNATTVAAILPGAAQLGIMRIDRDTLTARDVLNSGLDEALDTDLLIDPAAKSWGTLNNVLDQYAGVSNFGMQLLSIALVVALGIAIALFMGLFSLGGTSKFTKIDPKTQVRYYGASVYDAQRSTGGGVSEIMKLITGQVSIWSMLGISPTLNPFEKCLAAGALQFFAIDETADNMTEFATKVAVNGLVPASQNPGFYSVMARSFNRSFLTLADYFVGLAKAFGAGVVAGLQQLFAIIDVLRSSKFIKFLNIFGQLGDKKLDFNANGGVNAFEKVDGAGKKFLTRIDIADDKKPGKGRVKDRRSFEIPLSQAASSYRAPSGLLVPPELLKKGKGIGAPRLLNEGAELLAQGDGRLSSDYREELEKDLEGEYVPFYIHDVRTNEIVGFHAYLTSLSDDYSASYDSMEAFGRVEPIKTYKGTTRKISFSFILAAYSQKDYENMWVKINKLTTMVYPQFSEGRKLVSPDGKYSLSAPFSQSISAAPLVRVRIGDLIRSNYSKFALSRLFGLYYADSKLNNMPSRSELDPSLSYEDALEQVKVAGNTFFLSPGTKLGPVAEFSLKDVTNNDLGGTDSDLELPQGYVVKIKPSATDGTGSSVVICVVEEGSGENPEPSSDAQREYGGVYSSKHILDKSYTILLSSLVPSVETIKKINTKIQESASIAAGPEYEKEVKSFMGEVNGNAISRSFRTVGGKGLPGFIETLAFDWYDKVTWEIDDENQRIGKAPKMCKVTVSFSPFHDITPGLDHRGFNRAPIYPVGPMAPRE